MPKMKPPLTSQPNPPAETFRPQLPGEKDDQYKYLKGKSAARFRKDRAGHRDARARGLARIAQED
jgi:hypothetical protein